MNFLRRFLRCTKGAAALEAAVVLPVFLTLTVGMVDLGSGMFIAMEVNNAAQAGAATSSTIQRRSRCPMSRPL